MSEQEVRLLLHHSVCFDAIYVSSCLIIIDLCIISKVDVFCASSSKICGNIISWYLNYNEIFSINGPQDCILMMKSFGPFESLE